MQGAERSAQSRLAGSGLGKTKKAKAATGGRGMLETPQLEVVFALVVAATAAASVVSREEEEEQERDGDGDEDGRKDGSQVADAGLFSGLASALPCIHFAQGGHGHGHGLGRWDVGKVKVKVACFSHLAPSSAVSELGIADKWGGVTVGYTAFCGCGCGWVGDPHALISQRAASHRRSLAPSTDCVYSTMSTMSR